ncbi:MAG TPA: VOC family protein [Telluria sp.]|nr:VOC family protein [Telluria sp.]
MTIELDHILIPVRDKIASAKTLAWILDVPWSESGIGPFAPVYLNDGLTLDFDEAEGPYPVMHYCFRVGEPDFAKIVARLQEAGIPYRGTPHGPDDRKINTQHGGSIVYWNEPGGHVWEALTVSYARRAG